MSAVKKTTSNNNYNRRRFNDDQIKSLETTFETEARPELRLKQHLASKLGLQPRQVAIWFQNKRARSKSKQLEREYSLLKSDFDKLGLQYDNLKKENQSLFVQVERLRKMADKTTERDKNENNHLINASFALSESYKLEICNNHSTSSLMNNDSNNINKNHGDHHLCINNYLEDEIEDDVLNMARINNGEHQGSSELVGCSFESCNFLDNTAGDCSSNWWDF